MSLEQIISSLTKHFFSPLGREYKTEKRMEQDFLHFHLQEQQSHSTPEIAQTKPKRYETPMQNLPHLPEPPRFEWANLGKYIYGVNFITTGQIRLNESLKGTYEAIKTWVHEKMHLIDPLLEEYVIMAREAAIFFSGKVKEKYSRFAPSY